MRALVLAGTLAVFGLGTASSAEAERWCVRDFGAGNGICVFPTARDCVMAATVRGGVCERDVTLERRRQQAAPIAKRKSSKRTASHS
jgi:hypothetical protein